jgi:hypothetical protein
MHLQHFNYNGTVIQRRADGFVSLTQMCQANGKRLDHFLKASKTKDYIEALTQSLQMGVLESERGGDHSGTWGHPSLAINLARWISADFAVWCDAHIFNLMATGSTSLEIDPIEEMKLKIELAKLEAQKETAIAQSKQADLALTQFRHTIVHTCPEPVQQKILGFSVVEKVEYRDRIIKDDEIVNDGGTVTKTYLCDRYGFKTKSGKPDYKALNLFLAQTGLESLSEAWQLSAYVQESQQLKREYLGELDRRFNSIKSRQMFLGE